MARLLVARRSWHSTSAASKSPFESNILRLIRKRIDYRLLYFPPLKPVLDYGTFIVEDHPGEQRVTLKGKHSDNEKVKIVATRVDAPKMGDKGLGAKPHLHLSLLVDVWKGEGLEHLEFVCSSWPDRLEVQRVFMSRPNGFGLSIGRYMGPNIRIQPRHIAVVLDTIFLRKHIQTIDKMLEKRQLQTGVYDYLKMRGVNDDLSVFLHRYMMNKDRAELIQWFKKLETFVEC